MRFTVCSPALQVLAALAICFCQACSDSGPTVSPSRLVISVEPSTVTVLQGDSSEVVAVVTANFTLVNDPYVFLGDPPPGVSIRVSRTQRISNVVSVFLLVTVLPTATPGSYEVELYATNSARVSPVTRFTLKIDQRPECSQAVPCIQWAASATASSQYSNNEWSALQATGAPNVHGCSDDGSAWAADSPYTVEWLELGFREAMMPVGLRIYENYGASAIVSIEVKDEQGVYHAVYTSTPAHLSCPSIRTIPVTLTVKVSAVRLNLDQRVLRDWNEIDAVGLLGYRVK